MGGEQDRDTHQKKPIKHKTPPILLSLAVAVMINLHIPLLDHNLIKKVELSFHRFLATECITTFS